MRDDFAAFILTHGRPDRVFTLDLLERTGYTGRVYLVIDDEDATGLDYRRRYGDQVLTFSKEKISKTFDEGDNLNDRRSITYARNACWQLARQVGVEWFIQLDDDYTRWSHSYDSAGEYLPACPQIRNLDTLFEAMVQFMKDVPYCTTVASAQYGDFIAGVGNFKAQGPLTRKAMNTFVCHVDRPMTFVGRMNEDVNTYTAKSRTGEVVAFTFSRVRVQQMPTQSNAGGITELYREIGTYTKSFYTVMMAPSAATVRTMGVSERRLHHRIDWNATAPRILHERHRKSA